MEFIKIYDNILSDDLCDKIMNYYDNNDNKFQGSIGGNLNINLNIKNVIECKLENELLNDVNIIVENIFNIYKSNYEQLINLNFKIYNYRIKKYIKNEGFYEKHVDSLYSNNNRIIAIIIYLNDVDDGGETTFYFKNCDMLIKPKKGRICIFPANWCFLHKGNIPKSNDKYIINTFVIN